MLKYISIFSFIFLSFTHNTYGEDTIPPTGKIIRPLQWSIIPGNIIRVKAEAFDNESGIKAVKFFVMYRDINRSKHIFKEIGKDSLTPYEIIWDCSDIMDQSALSFCIYCKIYDFAGNMYCSNLSFAVIDRNSELSKKNITSLNTNTEIIIDGVLEKEWYNSLPIEIQNDDNYYKIFSCWDNDNLYLAAVVQDNYIYTRFNTKHNDPDSVKYTESTRLLKNIWLDDCVCFFFDNNANHTSLLEPQDKMLYISPTGVFLAVRLNIYNEMFYQWKGVRCSTQIMKTARSDTSGYIVETSIPWKSLNIIPENISKIGFEFYMADKESADGERIISAWSGQPHNHFNPSEWGTLTLRKQPLFSNTLIVVLIFSIIVITVLLVIIIKRKKKPSQKFKKPVSLTRNEELVKKAEEYIHKNYTDLSLNREMIAESLHISTSYLSEIFKKNTNKSLPKYINELRLVYAKDLLLNTTKKITEIAFDAGFGTSDHFIIFFRNHEGITPSKYRKKHSNPKNNR